MNKIFTTVSALIVGFALATALYSHQASAGAPEQAGSSVCTPFPAPSMAVDKTMANYQEVVNGHLAAGRTHFIVYGQVICAW